MSKFLFLVKTYKAPTLPIMHCNSAAYGSVRDLMCVMLVTANVAPSH